MTISLIQVVVMFWAGLLLWIVAEYIFYRLQNNNSVSQNKSRTRNSRKKRILWFTDTINDLNGVSITLKNIGWLAHKRGDDITIVASMLPDEDKTNLPPNVINLKPVIHFKLPYYHTMTVKVPNLITSLITIYSYRPDEIYLSSPSIIGTYGMIFAKLFRIKTTAIYHTDFSMLAYNVIGKWNIVVKIIEFYTKHFHLLADTLLVPTNEYTDILKKRGFTNKEMGIFYRGIDTNMFRPIAGSKMKMEQKFRIPSSDINLLYTGRISEDKNINFLINSVLPILKSNPDVNLILAGTGPAYPSLLEQYASNKQIYFVGRLDNYDLPSIYSGSDLLVFPSETDTFGMTVLEALSCGIPALVSHIGGPRNIVEDGKNGFVLNSRDTELWRNKITALIKEIRTKASSYTTLCENARNHVLKNFDFYKILDNYVDDAEFHEYEEDFQISPNEIRI
ncbi:MAG: glycosyltransferase [Spirochaetes bacterium]|jgi:glycosyltransferase involved in cell wall biosynthesis|nr:glycosyltransferase [Spirochaetota bacterium]